MAKGRFNSAVESKRVFAVPHKFGKDEIRYSIFAKEGSYWAK